MSTKRASHRFNFPATKLIFIFAVKPDTEYNADGVYQVTLVYPLEQARAIKAQIEALDPSFVGLCNYREGQDGEATFKVKQNRFIRWMDRKTGERQEVEMKPMLLNKDNSKFEGLDPWGGTIGEVGAVIETQAGANRKGTILAMRFRGMRIHELVEGSGGDSGDPMFGGPMAMEDEDGDMPFDIPTSQNSKDLDDDESPI